jgi:hypothetical protein
MSREFGLGDSPGGRSGVDCEPFDETTWFARATYGSVVFVMPATLLTLLLVAYAGSLLYFAVRLGWSLYWTVGLQRC